MVETEGQKAPFLSNRSYDGLKWVAQYGLPGLGALYFALASIWGLPYGEQIVGTITAVDVFLGVLLGLSTRQYNSSEAKYDGSLVVNTADPERDVYSLEVNEPLENIQNRKELTFKVEDLNG